MIGIHPIHRRLTELHLTYQKRGWSRQDLIEIQHCLRVNAELVQKLDALKELAFHAHEMGDMDWEQNLCKQIDELEAKMI